MVRCPASNNLSQGVLIVARQSADGILSSCWKTVRADAPIRGCGDRSPKGHWMVRSWISGRKRDTESRELGTPKDAQEAMSGALQSHETVEHRHASATSWCHQSRRTLRNR
jgi:hypothetical protein